MIKKLKFLFAVLCFIGINSANASHAWGAEINYTWVSGNTYRFELVFYRSCSGITPSAITLNIAGCGGTGSIPLTQFGAPVELLGVCSGASTCATPPGAIEGVQKYVYQGDYTFPSQCADWRVSFGQCCRSAVITNLSGAFNYNLYVEAHLNNLNVSGNSSPKFNAIPLLLTIGGQATNLDFSASDIDGDEIVYDLVQSHSDATTSIPYNSGFTAQQPMCSIPANSGVFDPQTGFFSVTPCPNQYAILTVRASEYRVINGVRTFIGSAMRDAPVTVMAGNSNLNPSIGTAISSSGTPITSPITTCIGGLVSFQVSVSDANATDVITATMNNLPQGATSTITGTNPVNISFSWTPTANDIGLHIISLHSFDNFCPVQGNAHQGYTIIVQGINLYSNTTAFCKNTPTTINLNTTTTAIAGGTYTWSANPSIPNFAPANTATTASATIDKTTTFYVRYNGGVCNTNDSLTVQAYGGVVATPSFTVFNPATSASPIQATAVYPNPAPQIPNNSGIAGAGTSCTGSVTAHTIGTGLQNTSTTSSIGSPFQGFWDDGRFLMLFTAAELQAAGVQRGRITKLTLNITSKGSTIPYSNFTIKMGGTTAASLSVTTGFIANNSTVYTNTAYTTAVGLASFTLQSPYLWNGVDNLMVEMCYDNSAFTNYDNVSFTPTTGVSTVLYRHIDGAVGCNVNSPTSSINRPDIIFYNCPIAPPQPSVSYAWSSQSGTITNPAIANPLLTPTGILNTTDRFILTVNDGTCSSTDTVVVLNSGACGVSAVIHENSMITCVHATAELDAASYSIGTGALSYSWSNGTTAPTITVATTGIYTVTITAAGTPACTSTASINVIAHTTPPPASISAVYDTVTCSHYSSTLTANPAGAYTYNWANGLGTAHQISTYIPDTYTVTITDIATGCTAATNKLIYVNRNSPVAAIHSNNGTTLTCGVPSIILDACSTPPNPNYSYQWSDGGTICNAHIYSQSGYYTVTVTDNHNGCTSSMSFNILADYSVNNNQTIAINAASSPLGCGHAQLNVPNVAPNHSFLWNTGIAQDSLAANTYGVYTVTVTNSQTSCSATASYNYTAFSAMAAETAITDCTAATGVIQVFMQGGISPNTIVFDGNMVTNTANTFFDIINIDAGTHLITVESSEGCVVNLPITTYCAQAVLAGMVFEDANSNGTLDATETTIANQLITATQNGQTWYGLSDANGIYTINTPTIGDYTLDAPNLTASQTITTAQPLTATAILNDTTRTNIGIHTAPAPFNLSTHLYHSNLRPGFSASYTLYYVNTGATTAHNVVLKLSIQGFSPTNITCALPYTVSNDTISIAIGDVLPTSFYSAIYLYLDVPVATPLGIAVQSTLHVEPFISDSNPANNTYTMSSVTTGSFDPNDKKVNIETYTFDRLSTGAVVRPSPELVYTVRFQNTGSDTAFTVRILDTLSGFLDISTFKLIGSSHPCTVQIDNNRVANFTFNHILLPDSTHNEAASHGFVQFVIRPNDALVQNGVPIRNRAAIYFDYNTAVATNDVFTTPSLFVITVPAIDSRYSVTLAPNPATNNVLITTELGTEAAATLVLRDALGRVMSSQSIKNNQATNISVNELPQGIYFTEIWLHEKLVASKKLVKIH